MLRCWRPKPTAQLRKLEDDLVKKGVTDQADGLRRLMGRSAARWVTVLGSAHHAAGQRRATRDRGCT